MAESRIVKVSGKKKTTQISDARELKALISKVDRGAKTLTSMPHNMFAEQLGKYLTLDELSAVTRVNRDLCKLGEWSLERAKVALESDRKRVLEEFKMPSSRFPPEINHTHMPHFDNTTNYHTYSFDLPSMNLDQTSSGRLPCSMRLFIRIWNGPYFLGHGQAPIFAHKYQFFFRCELDKKEEDALWSGHRDRIPDDNMFLLKEYGPMEIGFSEARVRQIIKNFISMEKREKIKRARLRRMIAGPSWLRPTPHQKKQVVHLAILSFFIFLSLLPKGFVEKDPVVNFQSKFLAPLAILAEAIIIHGDGVFS